MAGFLEVFRDVLIIFWVLVLLLVSHIAWGQYVVDPSKRTRQHVRGCAECRRLLLELPPKTDIPLCPEGRELYDRFGAW